MLNFFKRNKLTSEQKELINSLNDISLNLIKKIGKNDFLFEPCWKGIYLKIKDGIEDHQIKLIDNNLYKSVSSGIMSFVFNRIDSADFHNFTGSLNDTGRIHKSIFNYFVHENFEKNLINEEEKKLFIANLEDVILKY